MSQATVADSKALSMSMVPSSKTQKAGTLPSFEVTITNQTQEPVKFCRYLLDYRLKAAMVATGEQNYEAQPFVTQSWKELKPEDIVSLAPGESFTHHLSFQDDPIFGFVRRAKQPPIIPRSHVIQGFPKGSYSFNTALSNQVGLYIGETGVFNHKLQGRKVPDQWPGIEGCFLKLIEDSASVTFSD